MVNLAIVILNWNGYEDSKQCLESLYKNHNVSFQVILVDNGSNDNSVSKLKDQYLNLELITLPENIGFAAGNNVGIRAALKEEPEAILLLNNDTVLSTTCLEQMFSCLKRSEEIGAVVPKIFYKHDPELIWYAGGKTNWWKISVQHFGFRKKIKIFMM